MGPSRERGYAMLAAVGAVAFFGCLALEAVTTGRSAVASADAELTRAQLQADADAGVMMAIHGLGAADPAERWSLAGGEHVIAFNGAQLTILVEDEDGKIALNFATVNQVRRLFALAGADPVQAAQLTDAFILRRDGPAPGGPAVPHGPLSAIDELALLPGMTPALYARIAPVITVNAVTETFYPAAAPPLARAVMEPAGQGPAQAADQAAPAGPPSLAGHAVTIRVDVADGRGGAARRTEIVEFTGAPDTPYVIRSVD